MCGRLHWPRGMPMNKKSNPEVELFLKTRALVGEYLKTGPEGVELLLKHLCLNLGFELGPEETTKHLRLAGRYSITDLRRALFTCFWQQWQDRNGNNKAAFIRFIQQLNKDLPTGLYIGPKKHASTDSLRKYLTESA
jgi:hypothetical protein